MGLFCFDAFILNAQEAIIHDAEYYVIEIQNACASSRFKSYFSAKMFDLYKDPRESRPDNTIAISPWAVSQFNAMVNRHLEYKKQYPDRPGTHAEPYEGIENLRPKSQNLVEMFNGANSSE